MISIQSLRDNRDDIERSLSRRGATAPVGEAVEHEQRWRSILAELEALRAERNRAGKAIGKAGSDEERQRLIAAQRESAARIDQLEADLKETEAALNAVLAEFPNLVADETPDGADESANLVVRTVGSAPSFEYEPSPHWALGDALQIIDTERAAEMSGSRMYLLRGKGARLQRALIGWFLDKLSAAGYEEYYLPAMVRETAMHASGQLPKFRDNLYRDAEEDYFMVPTAEVPLTNLHSDAILEEADLPLKYAAHTPCFRREKASAGRDVRGIKRVHQFEKVEMYQFTQPGQSADALDEMLAHSEALLSDLGLHYRVIQLCSGDLGFSAAITYDLEVWAPGAQEWLEVSSISNCTDFQARRAGVRYRPSEGSGTKFVHTLNGSALALPRTVAAILENGQTADGSVILPKALHARCGFGTIEPPA